MTKIKIGNVIKQKEYNLLAGHFIPVHNRQVDYDWLKNLNAFVNKIVGGPVDVQQVSRLFVDSPNSNILLRDHPLSEQKDDIQQDPAGTGKRHANEMIANYEKMAQQARERNLPFPSKEQVVLIGANEPNVSGGDRNHMKYEDWFRATKQQCEIIDIYTANFLDTLTERGYIGGALNLSVGWPSNLKDDEPSYWGWFERTHQAILRGNHYLILHEYWADDGPDYMWGWWAGRFTYCHWEVPIIIGEAGIDQYVKDGVDIKDTRGYKGRPISHETYVAQIKRYLELVSKDKRIVAVMLYTSDCNHRDWGSFDLEPIYHLLGGIKDIYKVVPGNIKYKFPGHHVVRLPIVQNPPATNVPMEKYVIAQILNVRRGAGVEYAVVDQLALNTKVSVVALEKAADGTIWAHIGNGNFVAASWLADKPFSPPTQKIASAKVRHHLGNFARLLGIEQKVLESIFVIESGDDDGFTKDGKLILRFENHIFAQLLNNPNAYNALFKHGIPGHTGHMFNDGGNWIEFHGNQELEHKVLNAAMQIDEEIALQSASYGLGQVMGFNHRKLGYTSAKEMVSAFSNPEFGTENQLYGFLAFIINSPELISAIREKNWRRIAEIYNGNNADTYSLLLKNTYATL